jgi:serine/threonine protein kinase
MRATPTQSATWTRFWRGASRSDAQPQRYQCRHCIAVTSSNVVYVAVDAGSGAEVVVKASRPSLQHLDHRYSPRLNLLHEGAMLRRLEQAAVLAPRCLGMWDDGRQTLLVMGRIPGETLDSLARRGEIAPEQAVRIVAQLCQTAQQLHRLGYVHHDIKPANVIVRPDGVPLLIDWGISERIRPPGDLCRTIAFTPGFVSPEQVRGEARPGNDIYALGRTLDDLITAPPQRLAAIIARATAQPAERYPRAAALGYDLARLGLLDRLAGRFGLHAI